MAGMSAQNIVPFTMEDLMTRIVIITEEEKNTQFILVDSKEKSLVPHVFLPISHS